MLVPPPWRAALAEEKAARARVLMEKREREKEHLLEARKQRRLKGGKSDRSIAGDSESGALVAESDAPTGMHVRQAPPLSTDTAGASATAAGAAAAAAAAPLVVGAPPSVPPKSPPLPPATAVAPLSVTSDPLAEHNNAVSKDDRALITAFLAGSKGVFFCVTWFVAACAD
jgi:hypothetical protein